MLGSQSERVNILRKLVETLLLRSIAIVVFVVLIRTRVNLKRSPSRRKTAKLSLSDRRERPKSFDRNFLRRRRKLTTPRQVLSASVRMETKVMMIVVK